MVELHKENTVYIHALKYYVDDTTTQACFYIDEVPELAQNNTTTKTEKKFLWQSQKWFVTIYDESELPINTKRSQIHKRTLRRRLKGDNEGNKFEISEVFSVIPQTDRNLREFLWAPKDINIEEAYILVTYNENKENDSLINESVLSKSFNTSYAASQSVLDDFEITCDDAGMTQNSIEEAPVGALARLTYISEKLIHISQVQHQKEEKIYVVSPLNIKLQYEEPMIWIDPYEGNYGMVTSTFQVSERHGDSMESSLLQIKSRAGGYLSDFSYSFSDKRQLKRFRKHHAFDHHKYNDIPLDAVVIDELKINKPSTARHLSSSSTEMQNKMIDADDEEFEDLSIDLESMSNHAPKSNEKSSPPLNSTIDPKNISTPTAQAIKNESVYSEISIPVPLPASANKSDVDYQTEVIPIRATSKPIKMNNVQIQNNGDINDSGYDDSDNSPNHPRPRKGQMSYNFDSDNNSDLDELKKSINNKPKTLIISDQPEEEIVYLFPKAHVVTTEFPKPDITIDDDAPVITSTVDILSFDVKHGDVNKKKHSNVPSAPQQFIEEENVSIFKRHDLPEFDLNVLSYENVSPSEESNNIEIRPPEKVVPVDLDKNEDDSSLLDEKDTSYQKEDFDEFVSKPGEYEQSDILHEKKLTRQSETENAFNLTSDLIPRKDDSSSLNSHFHSDFEEIQNLYNGHGPKQQLVINEVRDEEDILPTPPKLPMRKKHASYSKPSKEGEKVHPVIFLPPSEEWVDDNNTSLQKTLVTRNEFYISENKIEPTVKETAKPFGFDTLNVLDFNNDSSLGNNEKNRKEIEYVYSDYINGDHVIIQSPSDATVVETSTLPIMRRHIINDSTVETSTEETSPLDSTSNKPNVFVEISTEETSPLDDEPGRKISLQKILREKLDNNDDLLADNNDNCISHKRGSVTLQIKPKAPNSKIGEAENFLDDDIKENYIEKSDSMLDIPTDGKIIIKKKSFASKTKKFVMKKLRPKNDTIATSPNKETLSVNMIDTRECNHEKQKEKSSRKSSFKRFSASIKLRKQKDKTDKAKPSEEDQTSNNGFIGFEKLKYDDDELSSIPPISDRLKQFSQYEQQNDTLRYTQKIPNGSESEIKASFRRSRSFESLLNTAGAGKTQSLDFLSKYQQEDNHETRERRRRLAGYTSYDVPSHVVKGREYTTEACVREMEKEINFIRNERKKRLGEKSSMSMDFDSIDNSQEYDLKKQRELESVRSERRKRLSNYSKSMDVSIDVLSKVKDVKPLEIPGVFLKSESDDTSVKNNGNIGKLSIPSAFSVPDLTEY